MRASRRLLIAAVPLVLLATGLIGFRCRDLSPTRKVCYSWFRPAWLTITDAAGRPAAWIHRTPGELPEVKAIYVSSDRDGFMTDIIRRTWSRYGPVQAHELARAGDGRVDLEITIHGKALTHAVAIDAASCRQWRTERLWLRGARAVKYSCLDPLARRPLSAAEARAIVAAMNIPKDRDFIKEEMRYSKGETLRTGPWFDGI